ncbi:MAG: folylpolyglutamate synthase/dihydrofolate synthase family protein [Alphaproteobacteria bacterium]
MSPAPAPETQAAANDRTLARLQTLHPRSMDLSLDRLNPLLAALGDPHKHLPPVVHVAGTNGKGSTVAYMRAALEAAGYRVHVYISPHLVRFNERIRLAGKLIDDAYLGEVLDVAERTNDGQPITQFEITTAAALIAFRDVPADILLLETGLGGRYDTTNVVEAPMVAAITTVSMDHQQFLGDDLATIAWSKAGILKPKAVGVIGPQHPDADAVIEKEAIEVGARLFKCGRDWHCEPADDGFVYRSDAGEWRLPPPALPGMHQMENAALAVACLEHCTGFSLSREQVALGLRTASWPARLQRLTRGPLVGLLPAGSELWLDGGHNPGAGAVIAATLAAWQAERPLPLALVFCMMANKDSAGFLAPFKALEPVVHGVPMPGDHDALTADAAATAARDAGLPAHVASDVATACRAVAATGQPHRVLICGSLYLAGEVLAETG